MIHMHFSLQVYDLRALDIFELNGKMDEQNEQMEISNS